MPADGRCSQYISVSRPSSASRTSISRLKYVNTSAPGIRVHRIGVVHRLGQVHDVTAVVDVRPPFVAIGRLDERDGEHVHAAGTQHAVHLGVRTVRIGDVFEHVGADQHVDRLVGERQRHQVLVHRRHRSRPRCGGRARSTRSRCIPPRQRVGDAPGPSIRCCGCAAWCVRRRRASARRAPSRRARARVADGGWSRRSASRSLSRATRGAAPRTLRRIPARRTPCSGSGRTASCRASPGRIAIRSATRVRRGGRMGYTRCSDRSIERRSCTRSV